MIIKLVYTFNFAICLTSFHLLGLELADFDVLDVGVPGLLPGLRELLELGEALNPPLYMD